MFANKKYNIFPPQFFFTTLNNNNILVTKMFHNPLQ